jgi:hypothetical protein
MEPSLSPLTIEQRIAALADKYAAALQRQLENRLLEMQEDNTGHYLIYQLLGISHDEGRLIDIYQNKGRFLYKYAGSFLEEAAKLCFSETFPDSAAIRIPNTLGTRPKTLEIKWRDATTDGDHVTKEHTRIMAIVAAGYRPVRLMFYYPNRGQAIKIQQTLATLYRGVNGEYYYGDDAWEYVAARTKVKLKTVLQAIADGRIKGL